MNSKLPYLLHIRSPQNSSTETRFCLPSPTCYIVSQTQPFCSAVYCSSPSDVSVHPASQSERHHCPYTCGMLARTQPIRPCKTLQAQTAPHLQPCRPVPSYNVTAHPFSTLATPCGRCLPLSLHSGCKTAWPSTMAARIAPGALFIVPTVARAPCTSRTWSCDHSNNFQCRHATRRVNRPRQTRTPLASCLGWPT